MRVTVPVCESDCTCSCWDWSSSFSPGPHGQEAGWSQFCSLPCVSQGVNNSWHKFSIQLVLGMFNVLCIKFSVILSLLFNALLNSLQGDWQCKSFVPAVWFHSIHDCTEKIICPKFFRTNPPLKENKKLSDDLQYKNNYNKFTKLLAKIYGLTEINEIKQIIFQIFILPYLVWLFIWLGMAVCSGLICPWLNTLLCPFPPLRAEGRGWAGGRGRSSAPAQVTLWQLVSGKFISMLGFELISLMSLSEVIFPGCVC